MVHSGDLTRRLLHIVITCSLCVCVCMYVCVRACVLASAMRVPVCIIVCVPMFVCVVPPCMSTCRYTQTRTHTHAHAHTQNHTNLKIGDSVDKAMTNMLACVYARVCALILYTIHTYCKGLHTQRITYT